MSVDPCAVAGSSKLRRLYLDPADAGVPWLLDPDNGFVRDVLASHETRRPDEPCDPDALGADIDDALVLICQRHIGIAEGEFAGPAMDRGLQEWAHSWRKRLHADRPGTWGDAIGLDGYRLRRVLGDSHCNVRGEDGKRVRAADPRDNEPLLDDPGPAAEAYHVGDVLCVRVRRLGGSPEQIAQLEAWANAHAEHFRFDRIVVDLRGNGGGGDQFALTWLRPHVPRAVRLSEEAYAWLLSDHSLNAWNYGIQEHAMYGTPFSLRPDPNARLSMIRDRASLEAGPEPWRGRMLVVTDRRVASAGESCTVFLRDALGARIIGTPSAGRMLFGNIAPYVLPRSGLVLRLGTTRFGYPPVEFTGIPVDTPLPDPLLPLAGIAEDFDRIWPD
ncbi:MAG: S41 family peptidase [Mycobacteriales bacterium]